LDNKIYLLDHGYIRLIESWGSDERIVEAARMSTAKGFLGWGPTAEDCENCRGEGYLKAETADEPRSIRCDKCGGIGKKPGDEKLLRFRRPL
jgi:DnaJ-class molecular chaperone